MMLEKVGDVGTMLAAFAEGMTQWRNHSPAAPESLPLMIEEMELAANFNKSEVRGIRDSSKRPVQRTRDNFLDLGDSADEPAYQNYQIRTCSYCTTAMHLTNKVPNQLSLVQANKNNYLGKPLLKLRHA